MGCGRCLGEFGERDINSLLAKNFRDGDSGYRFKD